MSVRLPVKFGFQCRKIAILDVFVITSLITSVSIKLQTNAARGCHMRGVFRVSWEVSLVNILD